MYGLVLLMVVALVSLLISRVATMALTATGLSRESARFQARSALAGVGYTTSESELVVNHPVRRRIVMGLMLLGSVGVATAVAGLLGTFLNADAQAQVARTAVLVAALAVLYVVSKSDTVDRRLSRIIARVLARYTSIEGRDVDQLLRLGGGYAVHELAVGDGHWLAGRALGEAGLREEGIILLGIVRSDGAFLGVPTRGTVVEPGDVVILYGATRTVQRLDRRSAGPAGDADHHAAVADHEATARIEQTLDHDRTREREHG